ncbi:TetR/AcrR family transcriptional regulator [Motiliproteus sp.]|uniref:TetR/AcrR family transcriptional regulator n=1 Tax=Motiliproteus sp. TaxID=1898955 RepID=UPI003BAA3103
MGRPSKKAERLEQILQAFHSCVARYGLEGSTLERIAETSGLQRSLVRHFAGNRDDLVQQLADRVIQQSDLQWTALLDYLPEQRPIPALLDNLFDAESSDPEFVLVIAALTFAAGNNPQLKAMMQQWMTGFSRDIEALLLKQYPNADKPRLEAVAFGLISLYFNLDSLSPLQQSHHYREPARLAAQLLVNQLDPPTGD